jgi:hypothetical protein
VLRQPERDEGMRGSGADLRQRDLRLELGNGKLRSPGVERSAALTQNAQWQRCG